MTHLTSNQAHTGSSPVGAIMGLLERRATQNNYYEMTPDGQMLVVPIVRSLQEVLIEREKVANYFNSQQILAGVVDLFKAQITIESKGYSFNDFKAPLHLELQHQIDVYNHVTGEEVIDAYKEDKKKRDKKRLRREARKRPHSSMDRAQLS